MLIIMVILLFLGAFQILFTFILIIATAYVYKTKKDRVNKLFKEEEKKDDPFTNLK